MSRIALSLGVVLMACQPTPTPAPAPTSTPTPTPAPAANRDAPVPLDAAWTQCASDAECTYVSEGCCYVTPVNRRFTAQAQRALDDAAHGDYCPVKAACGNGPDGTSAGTPGHCRDHTCAN